MTQTLQNILQKQDQGSKAPSTSTLKLLEAISPLFQTPRVQYTGYKKASGWSTGVGEDNFLILEKCAETASY